MKRFATIFSSSALLSLFLSTPLSATSNEYVVLESITAVNSTVTLGDNLEYELVVSSPTTFDWDPYRSNDDGRIMILLCEQTIYDSSGLVPTCEYNNQMSKYRLAQVSGLTTQTTNNFNFYTFKISGIPAINTSGSYFPFLVRIPYAKIVEPDSYSLFFYFGRISVSDTYFNEIDVDNVDFTSSNIRITPLTQQVDDAPQEESSNQSVVQESVPEQVPTSTPQPSSGSSNNKSVTVIATPAIQSNFMLPAIKGDQNWRPLKGIKGNFENWKVAKKNSLAGVPVRFTKTNGSMITFTTAGEAVSVRYLAGKKRGSFSIFVNGKFLERIDTNKKKKQSLVKTWNNLGEGKHYVDIVAELDNGQSLAISGVQKLKD